MSANRVGFYRAQSFFGYRGDCSHEIEKRPDNAPGLVLFGGLEGLILHRAVTLEH